MIRSTSMFAFVLCLLAVFSTSCASTRAEPKWVEGTVEAASDTILWQVTVLSLEKNGFPVGSGVDRGKLNAVSGWHTSLAPFKSDGYRERCHIEIAPQPLHKYAIKVRVERERNEDIAHPLDLSYAEWESDPDNVSHAQSVLGYIKATLGVNFEVTPKQ